MTRKTDENGEPLLFRGDSAFARYEDSVRYDFQQKLRVWFGECFYNRTLGVDYYNLLSSRDPNIKHLLENAVRETARTVSNLKSLTDLNVVINETTRACKITCKINTIWGLIDFSDEMNRTV